MTADKARTLIGMSVVELTKHLMGCAGLTSEAAYAELLKTQLFALLDNPDSRLYLEDDAFLGHCLDVERQNGRDALLELLNR